MRLSSHRDHRIDRMQTPSLQNWKPLSKLTEKKVKGNVRLNCGWGHLLFAHTYESYKTLLDDLQKEQADRRDIAFYVRDPHVLLNTAPQEVFLDPSHTFRLWFEKYRQARQPAHHVIVRRIRKPEDLEAANEVLTSRGMVPMGDGYLWKNRNSRIYTLLLAEHLETGEVVGFVMGIDHRRAFKDPEKGSSLWSLCVKRNCSIPGVGEALVRKLAETYIAAGCSFMDLSVMHDNKEAIRLYEKLNFERVPVFALKKRNEINENLYLPPADESSLNPYAKILFDEAQKRGIQTKVLDGPQGLMEFTWSGQTHRMRESLSDMTSALSFLICHDKRWTHRLLKQAQFPVPDQIDWDAENLLAMKSYVTKYGSVVVKPARGEQGKGVYVNLTRWSEVRSAARNLEKQGYQVILEQFLEGKEVRVIVINFEMVAAALRKPAEVQGTGRHTIKELIEKQSRRRQAETGGESKIPLDEVTEQVVKNAGFQMQSLLKKGETLPVRQNTNLHTGGTIHDITKEVSSEIRKACEQAAREIGAPVVGFDVLCSDYTKGPFWILEANERPGLANHEPQPTAEKFIDLLFPQTRRRASRRKKQ